MSRARFIFIISMPSYFVLFMTLGCAPPFPKETMDKVNRNVSFRELKKEPEKYKGTWVMLGGMIITSKNTKEGTLTEILHKPLDTDGRPLQTDATEGRFLVQSEATLDAAIYYPADRSRSSPKSSGERNCSSMRLCTRIPCSLRRN